MRVERMIGWEDPWTSLLEIGEIRNHEAEKINIPSPAAHGGKYIHRRNETLAHTSSAYHELIDR